jgi:phospholipase/lecithinase/hemolysin
MFILTPSLSFALKFKNIVTFGDSLSDHGNLKSQILDQPETKSNGDVWVDYLKKELNAELTNYAVIGAMTSKHLKDDYQAMSDAGAISQLGFVSQVNQFIENPIDFEPSETLFTIWIGANNFIKFGYGELGSDPAVMIQNAMFDISNALTKLINNNARHIVVLTLPDIGKSPWYNKRSAPEIQAATELASTYNYYLMATVDQITMPHPEVTVYKFELFQIMDELLTKNIFPNVTDSYMKLDAWGYALTETNGPPENYLFYDAVHPTTRAHEYFSEIVAERVIYHGYVTQQELDNAVLDERMKWDINNDNRIGIEEAIHALKTCSKIK